LPAFGRKLKIEDIQQVREERTASGKLVRDVISTKKKITLNYTEMSGIDLAYFLAYYEYFDELRLQIYYLDDFYNEYTVLMDPIERERILLADLAELSELWGNITVVFHEV
jgi:hypothetical protein